MRSVVSALFRWRAVRVLEPPDKELAAEGNIDGDVTMHSVLTEHVDAELLASLGEPEEGVECDYIGVNAPAFIVVHEIEELACH